MSLVLGIETSCDETGIGIVRGSTLLANVISSSMEEHARYGGVVPEVAARAHLEAIEPAIRAALTEAGVTLADLDAIAVTSGPGLAGALMVGVGAAKALALALDRPERVAVIVLVRQQAILRALPFVCIAHTAKPAHDRGSVGRFPEEGPVFVSPVA